MYSFQRKSSVKEGFMILEILLAIGLIGMITLAGTLLLCKENNNYKKAIKENRMDISCREALLFIEYELSKDVVYTSVVGNSIEIQRSEGECKDSIQFRGESIIMEYTKQGFKTGTNVILKGIKDFTAEQKGEIIYLCITDFKGKKYEKCFLSVGKEEEGSS